MKLHRVLALIMTTLILAACANSGSGRARYGEASGSVASQTERHGKITQIDIIPVDDDYHFGVGTVVGAVAGGLLGSQIGKGHGSTVATVAGVAAGAAAGTAVESKMKKRNAQRVNVQMRTGGQVTIVQPVDNRLGVNMNVRVDGSGEHARVVPE